MDEEPRMNSRSPTRIVLWHVLGLMLTLFIASSLRPFSLEPDPVLQGYLQVISALLAFVFAALSFVRFQGTQDRIALILGGGYLLRGQYSRPPACCSFNSRKTLLREPLGPPSLGGSVA